ncbi:hypothetical protein AN639_06635 [Candidatus Epulonipiscium fishelsonii]|uniref:Uncharacterized protein n=1 Tax=Candidatus Epulonipiscium fishelsonii TaxID=77094 RepID=A0ACC8XH15_9FIRM|nr:hypothetical protein AN639_06635 [Epulopiscium sp. SCG-B05WGA-EpuloA1]ONI42837.1 hypothetical protein AN396_13045 [Epulopiscium sp. SCG-B11WGA-EpuloA1]ONI46720.1 hypothetical protein AN644_02745 [Epulopiscium sp. SCG-C06WGA-EpuloA1]
MIKICGIRRLEDLEAINEFMPDMVGFIFASSKRRVSVDEACNIIKHLKEGISTVGVFVNEDIEKVVEISKYIDYIQLHGDEDVAYINEIRSRINNPLIKAIRVQNKEQILEADKLPVEYLLLDTYVKGKYGGCAEVFDYDIIPRITKKFILAGGINKDNINVALNTAACGVDISSGAELNGFKDYNKIKELIKLVKQERIQQQ